MQEAITTITNELYRADDGDGYFAGTIIDRATRKPVPFATIQIVSPNSKITDMPSAVADINGMFKIWGPQVNPPNLIQFSSVGYKTIAWELDYLSEENALIELDQDVKELDPVVVTAKKNDFSWLLIIAVAVMLAKKKATLNGKSTFNMNTLLLIAAGYLMLTGANVLNQVLSFFGLAKTAEQRAVDNAEQDPGSPLGTSIYLNAPQSVKDQLWEQWGASGKFGKLYTDLLNSFGAFNDNEAEAIGVFTSMPSKVVASYFAWGWEDSGMGNLITWLRGEAWPADRLDSEEINKILKYLNNLPKGY